MTILVASLTNKKSGCGCSEGWLGLVRKVGVAKNDCDNRCVY